MVKKGSTRHPRVNLKWCFVCKQYKDISNFYIDLTQSGGYTSICKSCKGGYYKDYQHQYYLRHRDRLLPLHNISATESYYNRRAVRK